jgi:hypothetical protein
MARKSLMGHVNRIRKVVESLGPASRFRKMNGIVKALEMQVEDGDYQRHAVARLGEALLATRELYDIPEECALELEELVCGMIDVVEGSR